jgi:bacillithiol biosynthesis cysteine-adding enzyme BshC
MSIATMFSIAIDPRELPATAGNRLYLDYLAGVESAVQFYSHRPQDFSEAYAARRGYAYPRQAVARLLVEYNQRLGAHPRALAHIDALGEPGTCCVITGQQAGFLGGPAYTAYKILTTMRLAEHLAERFETRVVPVFWLASEDHDFQEINHAYLVKRDGEIGRVRFRWREEGRPVADLPVTGDVKRAYDQYFDQIVPSSHTARIREIFSYRAEEGFGGWQARVWSSLFSSRGLVIVEPHVIRAAVPGFFRAALENVPETRRCLDDVAQRLAAADYAPALTSEQAGFLYTFDEAGRRVRVQDPQAHVARAASCPERYSTDAALRPLLADAALPVVASVLGPGEIAYQAMLRPLYDLFELPQPLLYPRQSYTILSGQEADRLASYQMGLRDVLAEQLDLDLALSNLVPAQEREYFEAARQGVERALSPLRSYVEGVDPGLARTWAQTVYYATRSLAKLEQRALKARTSQLGFSKGDLRRLQNALLPRGRPQERVLPLAHFMNRHGPGFIDAMFSIAAMSPIAAMCEAGKLGDFSHHVVALEDGNA